MKFPPPDQICQAFKSPNNIIINLNLIILLHIRFKEIFIHDFYNCFESRKKNQTMAWESRKIVWRIRVAMKWFKWFVAGSRKNLFSIEQKKCFYTLFAFFHFKRCNRLLCEIIQKWWICNTKFNLKSYFVFDAPSSIVFDPKLFVFIMRNH